MTTNELVQPMRILTTVIQDLVEAAGVLGSGVPAHDRERFDAGIRRVRQGRVALQDWIDAHS